MKDTATYARGGLNISKPICLNGLRFSRVTSKKEWMNRIYEKIGLSTYPSTKEYLLAISDATVLCFIQAMDIHAINSETANIHYIAHQFWEQEGPRTLLMNIIEKLSFNLEDYCKLPTNPG